jgi:serine/threonine protein kinase/Flp pilus assembly protein TadD
MQAELSEREQLLDEVVTNYFRAVGAGQTPDRQELLNRYPDLAAELNEFFADQDQVQELAAPLRSIAPAPGASGQTFGDFEVGEEIGRGGMGVVYKARQKSLNRTVALKVLPFAATMDPRQLQRFHNEAQAAANLHHTNIVPVYFVGSERGVHYYAMQYIEGRDLASVLVQLRAQAGRKVPNPEIAETVDPAAGQPVALPAADTRPLAGLFTENATRSPEYFRTVARLGIQAAEALDLAHQLGIMHRDVKPANLLVDAAGRLWVTDFGLAHMQTDTRLTMTGDLVGTLRYMSPEQALAKRVVVDHRTDVYSLGATLYELLTLRPAFTGEDRQELLRQVAFEEPEPPRRLNKAVPPELEIIVLKALEKNPAERYATAGELADDFQRFLQDEPIRAKRPTVVQRSRKWFRRHPAVVWSAVAVLAITVVLLAGSVVRIKQEIDRKEEARRATEDALRDKSRQEEIAREKKAEAEQAAEVAQTVLQFVVNDILGAAEPERSGGRAVTVAEVLAEAERNIGTAFKDQPLLEAAVRHAMGATYSRLGQFGPAERHFVRARELRDRILGPEHTDTLQATQNLAVVYFHQGKLDEAQKLTEQTLDSRRRLLGAAHKDTLKSMTYLAVILHDRGKREEAQKLLEEALTLQKHVLGAEHNTTLASMDELASMLYAQGKRKEARELLEEVLAIEKRILGPEHRDTIATMSNLSVILWGEGQWEEALKMQEDALTLRSRVLGPDHPATLQSMLNLASSLEQQGKREDARKLLDEAIPRQIRILGKEHPDTLHMRALLADLLEQEGKPEEAQRLLEEIVALQTRNLGAGHPGTLSAMLKLATVLKERGKWREARRLVEETRELATRTLGAEHPDTLRATNNLANLLWEQGERDQARKLLEENLAVRLRILGPEHPDTLRSKSNLADKLWGLGKLPEAHKLLEECLPLQTRRLGKEHPDTLDSMTNLANVLNGENKAEEAQKLHEEVLAVWKQIRGPEHPSTLRAVHNVATDLATHGKLEEGRKLHESNLTLFKRVCGPEHPDTLESMFCVATALLQEDKLEEARKIYEETIALQTRVFGAGHPKTLGSINNLVILLVKLGERLDAEGRYQEAEQAFRRTLALLEQLAASFPNSPKHLNALVSCQGRLAMFLLSCPDLKLRNAQEATALAQKAVERVPDYRDGWIVLGMAQYRAGNWKAAVKTLEESQKRFKNGNCAEWFILAMAHWQLGHKEEARQWFDRADEWMQKNGRQYRDLQSWRTEAAELLGIKDAGPEPQRKPE